MTAEIITGTEIAGNILETVRSDAKKLADAGKQPHLVAIKANDDAGTTWYAKAQKKHCEENGLLHTVDDLGADADQSAILKAIEKHNNDQSVHGIILFLPLPADVDMIQLTAAISPEKDAEGVNPVNLGRLLATGRADPAPCTAVAAFDLVKSISPDLSMKKALVVGRSSIVGKPLALLLLNLNASVMIAHSRSDIPTLVSEADVVVAATGAAGVKWNRYKKALASWEKEGGEKPPIADLSPLIKAEMVKPGSIVIDVGDNHVPKGLDSDGMPLLNDKGKVAMQYAGDVDFDEVKEVAGYLTSTSGGVGPITNAYLLRNTVNAAL